MTPLNALLRSPLPDHVVMATVRRMLTGPLDPGDQWLADQIRKTAKEMKE